jgi:hypothetical protein
MRTVPALAILLLISSNASAQKPQHKWSGNMLKNQTPPNRPPTASCKDGTFWYQGPDESVKHACEGHKGVQEVVSLQFVALSGHTLTEAPDTEVKPAGIVGAAASLQLIKLTTYSPQQFWLHPVITLDPPKGDRYPGASLPMIVHSPKRKLFHWTGLLQ